MSVADRESVALAFPEGWDRVLEDAARGRIEAALPEILRRQRWFGGKARALAGAEIRDAIPITAGSTRAFLLFCEVTYQDGATETYALPVTAAFGEEADRIAREAPQAVLARFTGRDAGPQKRGVVYDALWNEGVARRLLEAIGRGERLPGKAGTLAASATAAYRVIVPADSRTGARIMKAEQSNTSVAYGDRAMLKLYRRLQAGINPELEIGRALTSVAFPYSAPVGGAIEYLRPGSEPMTVGVLQAFVRNEGDAWGQMMKCVEEFLSRVPRQGAGVQPDLGWGRSLQELAQASLPERARRLLGPALDAAGRLGRRTAALHLALAQPREDAAFAPEPMTGEYRRSRHEAMIRLWRDTRLLLGQRREALPSGLQAEVNSLLDREHEVQARFRALMDVRDGGLRIRCHGDYHLGQVLWTGSDYVVIDFEGEPARPVSERRTKHSPLLDVAGMLRSFDYAGAAARGGRRSEAMDPDLAAWTGLWSRWVGAEFLKEYRQATREAPFCPRSEQAVEALLTVHLLEKAVYELGYELNNRPEWVAIPLRGVIEILNKGGTRAAAPPGQRGDDMGHNRPGAEVTAEMTLITAEDLHLFNEGTHFRLHDKLGAHPIRSEGDEGTYFAVWAPNAEQVSVIGTFNDWAAGRHPLSHRDQSGIWEGFVPGIGKGTLYKFHIRSRFNGYRVDKSDPFSRFNEIPPRTASIVWDLDYDWRDAEWMRHRQRRNSLDAPMAVYEMHLGSWKRVPGEGNRSLSYRELAEQLPGYLNETGFTHVEFLPVMDHPFFGSWGYQTTGYFAPSGCYGTPQDLMYLVDQLHRHDIGVILDWVPSHFPTDSHGLGYFDGTHLYEHADPQQGFHPEWNTFIFNYGRHEVRSFLISSALFWLEKYHIDGIRVDAVASMLYLDYSRKEGEWVPNEYGGRENLGAIAFLRRFNEEVYRQFPDVQTIAEESTSWPMVSKPTYLGGLGFGLKWDMGWMHDTLSYMSEAPIYRRYHHNRLTFRMLYAFHENFILPLSHDEVVYGKGSLLGKMPGDDWQKFANLRVLYGYMYAQAAKKLLFMGGEIGQWAEWAHDHGLEWELLQYPLHSGLRQWVGDLNRAYRAEPALHERDLDPAGLEWVDCDDADSSVVSLLRKGASTHDLVLVVCNFTPVPRPNYRVGAPRGGYWQELLNSDAALYGGVGWGNMGGVEAVPVPLHGRSHSVTLTLPPLAALFFRSRGA